MGQYYVIVNVTKREFIHPHWFNNGMKLMEFGCSAEGAMTALAILLSDGNGRGGGDLHSQHPIIGSWAGDRIVIAGDYADEGRFIPKLDAAYWLKEAPADAGGPTLYHVANRYYRNVSLAALSAMLDDPYTAADWARSEMEGAFSLLSAVTDEADLDAEQQEDLKQVKAKIAAASKSVKKAAKAKAKAG